MNRALVFVLMLLPASAWAAGYILEAAGTVTVAAGKGAPYPVVKYEPITSGTVVRTGNESHAVLKFEDGQVISMQSNSTLLVRSYYYVPGQTANNNITLAMYNGGARFISGLIGQRNPKAFRLATPDATIGILGTDFMVVMANNHTYSHVASGSISMTNSVGMARLSTGQTGMVSSVTSPVSVQPVAIPGNTFTQLAAIPVPGPVPAPVPPPVMLASADEAAVAAVTAAPGAAGGAAAGGAAVVPAAVAGGGATGISATTIGIGIGVAAIAAAVINQTTTQH